MAYQLWIKDEAKAEIGILPGYMRAQVRRTIESLRLEPRPYYSVEMTSPANVNAEVRRLKIEHWRVIYIVDEEWSEVGVLAVRKRPPYEYEDLPELLADLD
ncbi:MAG: type II toxin-antitoxin system RelE/ParE family toxin [Chloroflexota bacterium]|nr:type II toxin-antitoxin system RelE/ParE family toxin [Chloroflexota bacterium]